MPTVFLPGIGATIRTLGTRKAIAKVISPAMGGVIIGHEMGRALGVEAMFVERPTGTFQIGAGFSSVENFIAQAQVSQNNLFGRGQMLQVQAQLSSLRQLFTLRFTEPYFLDSDFSASVDLFDQLRIYSDFSQSSLGGTLTFGYPLTRPAYLRASMSYTLEKDKVSTTNTTTVFGTSNAVSVFQRLPLANLFNAGRTVSLRPAITYDTRDNRLFPTNGAYAQLSTELASDVLGSELLFFRHRWTGRLYYNLGGATGQPGSGFVLKANSELGLITSPTVGGVPVFNRFYLGGILDVRGRYKDFVTRPKSFNVFVAAS